MYRFKFYFKDGTTQLSGGRGTRPTTLYNDFDGLMDWDEFDSLNEEDMTTHKILEIAMEVYKGFYPEYYRIEIINDENNDVVDYIDEKEVKQNG